MAGLDSNEIRKKLYVGSKAAAAGTELKHLLALRISHVLSVGSEFPEQLGIQVLPSAEAGGSRVVPGRCDDGRIYLQEGGKKDPFVRLLLAVEDVSTASLTQHLDECRLFISEGMAQGGVLVHCVQGRSRSVAVVTAFLMMKEKLSLGKALLAVKEKRPEAAPKAAFIEQLRALEGRLNIAPASPRTAEAAGTQVTAEREVVNPQVFFEIALDGEPAGRIEMELFADRVPKTAENFRCLCTGEKGRGPSGKRLNFLGSIFHRVVPGLVCAGGDFTMGNGTGGESIYGQDFEDENFDVKHDAPGILSMANTGPSTNGSQFVICLQPVAHLDGRNVAFGRVVSGYEVVQKMEACGTTEKEFEEEEEAKKEGEEKEEEKKPEPTEEILNNPCRVLKAQQQFISFPTEIDGQPVRYTPILRNNKRRVGFLLLTDNRPDEAEDLFLEDDKKDDPNEKEPDPPATFEWADDA
mmetsp:Transcript_3890/g.11054  ORF Transcript_3890/g.11054 Transcript_3890/m.11054 type:complete len:466 (-) Transcript_3890:130-1527(-)